MQNTINTTPIQQFIQQVKSADASQQKEVKLDLKTAKILALCMGEVCAKLVTDYDSLINKLQNPPSVQTVTVQLDGGTL